VVSVTDTYSRILGFIDRSSYFFFQVAPQLYSRGWVHPVPDPLLLTKSGSAWNRTWTSGVSGYITTGFVSIAGANKFSEKQWVCNGVHSAS
jgi:hypothetical protein